MPRPHARGRGNPSNTMPHDLPTSRCEIAGYYIHPFFEARRPRRDSNMPSNRTIYIAVSCFREFALIPTITISPPAWVTSPRYRAPHAHCPFWPIGPQGFKRPHMGVHSDSTGPIWYCPLWALRIAVPSRFYGFMPRPHAKGRGNPSNTLPYDLPPSWCGIAGYYTKPTLHQMAYMSRNFYVSTYSILRKVFFHRSVRIPSWRELISCMHSRSGFFARNPMHPKVLIIEIRDVEVEPVGLPFYFRSWTDQKHEKWS